MHFFPRAMVNELNQQSENKTSSTKKAERYCCLWVRDHGRSRCSSYLSRCICKSQLSCIYSSCDVHKGYIVERAMSAKVQYTFAQKNNDIVIIAGMLIVTGISRGKLRRKMNRTPKERAFGPCRSLSGFIVVDIIYINCSTKSTCAGVYASGDLQLPCSIMFTCSPRLSDMYAQKTELLLPNSRVMKTMLQADMFKHAQLLWQSLFESSSPRERQAISHG